MKLGDVIESAIWLDGRETPEDRTRFENDVRAAVHTVCEGEGWLHSPVKFIEKHVFEDKVPQVPDHIHGPNVRMLVGEAEVVGKKPESKPASFIANLDRKDLMRLRHMTRAAHRKTFGAYPTSAPPLSDRECDNVIEECGLDAALATLQRTDTLQ